MKNTTHAIVVTAGKSNALGEIHVRDAKVPTLRVPTVRTFTQSPLGGIMVVQLTSKNGAGNWSYGVKPGWSSQCFCTKHHGSVIPHLTSRMSILIAFKTLRYASPASQQWSEAVKCLFLLGLKECPRSIKFHTETMKYNGRGIETQGDHLVLPILGFRRRLSRCCSWMGMTVSIAAKSRSKTGMHSSMREGANVMFAFMRISRCIQS